MKKRLLSLALVLVMALSLLPATAVSALATGNESGSTASDSSGAFGISTPSAMTTEEQAAAANNPFGAMGAKGAFPLLTKSELYLTYGWDGNNADNGVNYVKSYDTTETRVLPQFNVNGGTNRIGYNKNDVGLYDNTYMAASVDGFDPGTGKDEYVAQLGLNARSNGLELSLTNKQGQSVSDYVMFYRGSDNNGLSWLTGCSLHQMNGFLSVACGDFDGDGMDSIIMYEVGAGNSQVPSLRECTVTKSGSRYDIEKGTLVVGKPDALPYGLFSLLGDASDMTKTEAKNAAKVQMEAADTDKDGYDELVVTVSMNDTHYGEKLKQLGTQVFIFDKLRSGWTLTARFSMKSTGVANDNSYADDRYRMVWGTSSVGNVIASDDSGGSTDFPEIVTVGLQDNESKNMHNINVDGNDMLVYSVIHCTGMTEAANGMKNYKGKYEAVTAGNLYPNEFTIRGFYESEDVSPLLQTKCFSYKGAAEADAVFISGTIFTWKSDSSGSGKLEYLRNLPFYASGKGTCSGTKLTNQLVESVAAGNFDGNPDGREQIVSAFLLKEEGENNAYSGIVTAGWYPGSTNDDKWVDSTNPGGLCISKMGRAYVALTDFDCDADSVIVKYEGVEKQWSDPNVMAVLVASPYFHDIGLDNNSSTDYGIDRSTSTSTEQSHTLTTNIVAGFEYTSIFETGGGFEATIENNFTWSTNSTRGITYTTNYSNTTDENQVVVYRSPMLVFQYTDVNTGNKICLAKTLSPATNMISVEEYNAQAESYGLETIDESKLGVPGLPDTYPSSKKQIKTSFGLANENDVLLADTTWANYSSNGVITKGISIEEMRDKSFNYEFDFSFTAYGIIFGAKVGGGAGYGYETTSTVSDGTAIVRSGSVDGVGSGNYDFQWNFATWSTLLNGLSIPVCGYLVQNVAAPPSPAEDLRITDITASSLTLQWDAGTRPAEKYNIYRMLEASTDPYLYIGSVSGDGEEFSYSLSGLDSGTTYTFVVRGAAGDKESVDGLSATACTALTGGSSITINPLQSTYSVAPSDSVTLSTTIFTSADFASLQPVWQCRSAGKSNWVNLDATDTSLTLSNVSKSMDGNQYRLRVKATTTSANVGYYYSNAATLSVSTTGTQAELTVTGAGGGKGTLSPSYNPYTGMATSAVTTPVTEEQDVAVPATFKVDSTEGQVYKAGTTDNPVYIGEIEQEETGGESAVKYYALTKNGESYSATGNALTVTEKYIDGSGNTVTMPTGTTNPVTITVGSGESAVTYNAVALWNDADKYKEVWFQEQDGNYYIYSNENFTEINLEAEPWSAYTVLGNISYSSASQVVVSGSSTYLISGLGGGENDVPTKTLVTSEDYVTVGEGENATEYAISKLDPVTVTKKVTVITGYETTTQNGTPLTLTATLKKANSSQVLSGVGANFVITDQATGISQYIAKTSGTDGKISANWMAPAAGLYAIQVSITGTTTLGASLTAPQYYYASSQGSETQYRLRLKANSADVAGSIVYGSTITLVPESKTGTEEWTALTTGGTSGLSLTAVLQGGTVSTLDGTSYYPVKAGKYTFSLVKTDGTTNTTLATATLNVTPYKLTVTPVWEGTIPSSLDAVTLKFTDASGNKITSLPNEDMTKLTGALEKSTTYNFTNPGAGVFYVNLSWSDTESDKATIAALNGAYSITLANASFYKKANAMPVNYSVVNGLGGTMFATGADYKSFFSGEAQSAGTPLRFQATPDTGYYVRNWKVNGNEVAVNSPNYVITQISGGNAQMLTISSFDTTRDVSDGKLLVEVEFTNQLSTVTYSAAGQGSLTAQTNQGTAVQSGAKLAYGADLVFTAAPGEGQMVKEWKVTVNNGDAETYTWPGTSDTYRENTLILSDLAKDSYTVYVEFTPKQTFTVTSPVFVDGSGNPVNAGTITMTDASGNAVSTGDELEQGKAITYTVKFNDSNYNTVNAWEYSTDGAHWITAAGENGTTFTCCKGSTGTLYVRAVVSVAQTYALSWNVAGLAEGDSSKATLTAKSGNTSFTSGSSYAVNTPVEFTLTLDNSYYVVGWTNATQSSTDPKSATLTLTKDTDVTVTVAQKPKVTISSPANGNVTYTATKNGIEQTLSESSYVDPNTTITVTAAPNDGYVAEKINGTSVNTAKANGAVTKDITVNANTTVTATFLAKPIVSIDTVTGGTVEVKGKKDDTANTTITNGSYVDFGTDLTVTLKPDKGYEVGTIDGQSPVYTDAAHSDEKSYTISNVQADQTITPVWKALDSYAVNYSVVDTNGIEPGGTNGTLSASVTRKDMSDYAVTNDNDGTETVYRDSTVTLTAAPASGYRVKEWTVGGSVYQLDNTPYIGTTLTLDNISADKKVTVQFMEVGSKVTASAGDNGSITSAKVGNLEQVKIITDSGLTLSENASVVFTAQPAVGYEVACWSVNGVEQADSSNTFTYTAETEGVGAAITVTFRQVEYPVTWGGTNGTVSVDNLTSGASIRGGTSVTFTAAPSNGYVVGGWTVNGETQTGETSNTFTWTVPNGKAETPTVESYEIKAVFTRGSYEVSWGGDNATVTANGYEGDHATITGDTQVTFTAAPADGYILIGWTVDGVTTDTRSLTHTVTVTKPITVTAVIVPSHYEVNCVAGGETAGSTVTVSGSEATSASVAYGDSVTFTAEPAPYYHVSGWKVDDVLQNGTANKNTFTLTNVTAGHTVTAVFEGAIRYEVRYKANENGTLSATNNGEALTLTPEQTANVWGGSKLVFTAAPETGATNYMVAKWTVNGTEVTRDNMATLGVTMDHYLSNTLTVESLSKAMDIQVSFEAYEGYTIPTSGTGYTVDSVTRSPADTYVGADEGQIRKNGDLSFTVKPDTGTDYITISQLKINGYDFINGGSSANVTVVKNANGSYTVTITGVTDAISTDIVAHKVVVGSLVVPTALTSNPELNTTDKIQSKLETKLTGSSANRQFYDIALKYYDSGTNGWVEVTEANFPTNGVDVVLPYPAGTDNKDSFTIVHMLTTEAHAGELEIISPEKKADGLHFHVNSLSPFGISWTKYVAPSGGGGGGGGGAAAPAETVIIKDSVNGKVAADNTCAAKGDTVTLTVTPDKGYTLETLTVTDKNGDELKLIEKNGKYTFTMLASNVTVQATFMEDNSMLNFFVDVPVDAYYYDAVLWAAKEGITGGIDDTHFAPNAACTRAQAVTFLWRAAGSPASKSSVMTFTDVAEGSYYRDAVLWAVENGITKGTSDTTFAPNAKCSRAQIVTFLWRSQKSPAAGTDNPFTDVAESVYYADAVLWAAENGITGGTTATTFSPDNDCTRAQIVTFLYRCMK